MEIVSYILGEKSSSGITPTGTINITQNGETDVSSYATANVSVSPDLESKSVTITTNTTTTITPSQDKDGLSSVEVTTNVPSQKYAPAFGGICFGNYTVSSSVYTKTNSEIQTEIQNLKNNVDTSHFTILSNLFRGLVNLTTADLSSFDFSNVENIGNMFYGCTSLNNVNMKNFTGNNVIYMSSMFQNCENLLEIDLSDFETLGTPTNFQASNCFYQCTSLQKIDIRKFDFSKLTSHGNMFGSSSIFSSQVPSSCLIIVKDTTQKSWVTSNFTWLTNVKTVAEYEAS